MRLINFRVSMYRSILDSKKIEVSPLTVLIGKNESGKTSLLKALHKLNPSNGASYDLKKEWPRSKRNDANEGHEVVIAVFELNEEERRNLKKIARGLKLPNEIKISKDYYNGTTIFFDDLIRPYTSLKQRQDRFDELFLNKSAIKTSRRGHYVTELRNTLKSGLSTGFSNKVAQIAKEYNWDIDSPELDNIDRSNISLETKSILDMLLVARGFELWWSDTLKIERAMREYIGSLIPKFIYIDEYSVFSGKGNLRDILNRKNNNAATLSDYTVTTMLNLAGLDIEKELEKIDSGDLNQQQYDLEDAGNRISSLISKRWNQRDFKIEFRSNGDNILTFVRDELDSSLIGLEERSKGFQWFLSFDLTFMKETNGEYKNAVLLLDEPGLYLHPDAQVDMVRRLEEYAASNTIIYTTHLPFMIDLAHPERIRVMRDGKNGSFVSNDLTGSDYESKLVLQSALGMKGSNHYLISKKNLVVEGVHDYWIISALSNLLQRNERQYLSPEIMITPAGGASHAVTLSAFMIGQGLDVVCLLDSDKSGDSARRNLEENWIIKNANKHAIVLQLGKIFDEVGEFEIEDIFEESYYTRHVKSHYSQQLDSSGITDIGDKTNGQGIATHIEAIFKSANINFSKGAVAIKIRNEINNMVTIDSNSLLETAEKLITRINDEFQKMQR